MADFDLTPILKKIVPEKDGEPNITLRAMTVSVVNADGTVDLVSGGETIPGVGMLNSTAVAVGSKVQVLTGRGVALVLGVTGGVAASTTWTPTLIGTTTNPVIGTGGTLTGQYWREAGFVTATMRVVFGTTGFSAGGGDYRFSIPVAASASLTASTALGAGHPIGTATLRNATTPGNSTGGIVQLVSSTAGQILAPGGGAVGAANPWAWASNGQINVMMRYPTAL